MKNDKERLYSSLGYIDKCPYCGSENIGINADDLAVCLDCGTVFQTYVYYPPAGQSSSPNIKVTRYRSSSHIERVFWDSRPAIRSLANEMFNYCVQYKSRRTGNRRVIEYCVLAVKAVIDIIVRGRDPWDWLEKEMEERDMRYNAMRKKLEKILRHYCVVIHSSASSAPRDSSASAIR